MAVNEWHTFGRYLTKVLETARHLIRLCTDGNPPPLLDPFAGGGSIPLEAQRLGLEAHASDLNPVAVMINKAQIEIPPRFANCSPVNPRDRQKIGGSENWKGVQGLAADVRYYGEWMREKAWERIGHLYPKHNSETVIAWIWARTLKSPNPALDVHVPLVRSFDLSKKKGRQAWVEPQVDPVTKQVSFKVYTGQGKAPQGTMSRQGGRCIVSGVPITWDYIRSEGQAGRMGTQLIAIVTKGHNDYNYYAPDEYQTKMASQVQPKWSPVYPINHNPRDIRPQLYGITTYAELFTPRQLEVLSTLSDLINDVRQQVYDDCLVSGSDITAKSYSEAICLYLSFAIDKCTDYWTTISTWMPRGTVGHAFARQAMPMTWDFPEANPFADFHCAWHEAFEWVAKAVATLQPSVKGYVEQADATQVLTQSKAVICTDPPYYDNIAYADLSDYFYIWLRRSLKDVYPEIFSTMLVPKAAELVASSHRFDGSQNAANAHFEMGLTRVFGNIKQTSLTEFPISIYYAFKQTEVDTDDEQEETQVISNSGWETMLEGLIATGFAINGTWPVRSERSVRSIAIGANALASSVVLVCRPRSEDAPTISRRAFVDALRRELPPALRELQSGNIAPVDLAQASIGPGMAVYSRYAAVLEADGSPLSVRTALQLINQELDAYLAEQEGDLDADTRFAVSWFEQYGFNDGQFGQADVLARAKNTSVQGVVDAGIVTSGQGKVRLLHWGEYDAGNWNPAADRRRTVWEAVHHLIERLNTHSESGAAGLVTMLPNELAADARALAYRLYTICDRKGWAEHARDYNALVISWPQITALAAEQKNTLTQQDMFGE